MEYKYYYLYQITNLLNGKIYIGAHRTNNLDDEYMGSGKYLKNSQNKHGVENFKREILEFFESEKDMFSREIEYVTAEFVLRKDTYNLLEGGHGGFSIESCIKSGSISGKINGPKIGKHCYENNIGIFSEEAKENHRRFNISEENLLNLLRMSEKATNEESRDKRKEAFKRIKHQQGEKNSQFGTMWITNGKKSMRIKKNEVVQDGWRKGRVIKFNN